MDGKADKLLKEYEGLKTEQQSWLPLWQELADHVQPRKADIYGTNKAPNDDTEEKPCSRRLG